MSRQLIAANEAEALKAAFTQDEIKPTQEEIAHALHSLAPHIGSTAQRLVDKQAERRAGRLQAWGLAGCSLVFVMMARLGCQYKELLLAKPERWGIILGLGIVAVLVVGCLPIVLRKEEGMD